MKTLIELTVLFLLWVAVSIVYAEKATELFIPMGQSPGLSHEGKTVQGVIANIDYARKILMVGLYKFIVSDQTSIYIDRSHLKLQNQYGKFVDLKVGEFVEVYAPHDDMAEWVKIRGME